MNTKHLIWTWMSILISHGNIHKKFSISLNIMGYRWWEIPKERFELNNKRQVKGSRIHIIKLGGPFLKGSWVSSWLRSIGCKSKSPNDSCKSTFNFYMPLQDLGPAQDRSPFALIEESTQATRAMALKGKVSLINELDAGGKADRDLC